VRCRYRIVNKSKEGSYHLHFFYTVTIFFLTQPDSEFFTALPNTLQEEKQRQTGTVTFLLVCILSFGKIRRCDQV
jgi:CRISPR/Cas system endoribonuclease Cas6 (RAMP superfamily)